MNTRTNNGSMGLIGILGLALMAGCGDETVGSMVTDCSSPAVGCPSGFICGFQAGSYQCMPGDGASDIPVGGRDAGVGTTAHEEEMNDSPWGPGIGDGHDDGNNDPEDNRPPQQGNGGEDEDGCRAVRVSLKPNQSSVPRMMLVVDRSYSMVGIEDRWTPITSTLGRVTDELEDAVQFGLVLFPSPNPDFNASEAQRACSEAEVNVAPGAGVSADIARWLTMAPPQEGLATPTYSGLEAAGRLLAQNPTGNDYILLATDGGPGCNFVLDPFSCTCLNHACPLGLPEMCLDDNRTVNKVRELAQQGIKTIVLGMTGQNFLAEARDVLDRMAVAGGTAVDGRHFEVDRVDDLEDAIAATAGSVAPCKYELGDLVDNVDELVISIDGEEVAHDPSQRHGWDIRDGMLEFFGASCQSLRDGRAHAIDAGCR